MKEAYSVSSKYDAVRDFLQYEVYHLIDDERKH